MTLPASVSWFGPPSEQINLLHFSSTEISSPTVDSVLLHLTDEEKLGVEAECSVSDIQHSLSSAWDDPTFSSHVLNRHDALVSSTYATVKAVRVRRKRQLPTQAPLQDLSLHPHVQELDEIKLSCWQLPPSSASFMRTLQNADHNTLTKAKLKEGANPVKSGPNAVVVFSVYNRSSWNPSLVLRVSQHVLLSSQTLADLCTVIPCISKAENSFHSIYMGDVLITNDGGEAAVTKHLSRFPVQPPPRIHTSTLSETRLDSLTPRINQPYWYWHQGNCEHFIIFDQIRLPHKNDSDGGYPLTTHLSPPLHDLCRACGKVPAIWSVTEDLRLGQSPCLLCGPCWGNLEGPGSYLAVVTALPVR